MMKIHNWLAAAAIAAALCLSASDSLAQNNGGGGGGGGRRGGGGGGNFDPAQARQRTLDRYKETLEVTKDDEWQALQPRIEKVMDARTGMGGGMGRGMFGGGRRGGAAQNADANAQGAQQRRTRPGQTPMPEAEALQKAIDDKVPAAELKAALAKYSDARKIKQDQLKAAQEDLRKLLTPRQEAIASLNGLL